MNNNILPFRLQGLTFTGSCCMVPGRLPQANCERFCAHHDKSFVIIMIILMC